MTEVRKQEVVRHIEELKKRLENWKRTPMQEAVRQVGVMAIRAELSRVARPLSR